MKISINYIDQIAAWLGLIIGFGVYVIPLIYVLNCGVANPTIIIEDKVLIKTIITSIIYSYNTSVYQIIGGFSVAYLVSSLLGYGYSKRHLYFQLIIDCTVLSLYFMPSIGWKFIADEMFRYNGWLNLCIEYFGFTNVIFRKDEYMRMIEFWYISVMHLFPFSYLVYRYVLMDIDRYSFLYIKKRGYSGLYYHLRYKGEGLIRVTFMLMIFRFFVMFGKYDLPYLFDGLSNSKIMTFSIWIGTKIGGYDDFSYLLKIYSLTVIVFIGCVFAISIFWILFKSYFIRIKKAYNAIIDNVVSFILTVTHKGFVFEKIIIVVGLIYIIIGLIPVILAFNNKINFAGIIKISEDNKLLASVGLTYIYVFIIIFFSVFVSYMMYVTTKIKYGLLIFIMFLMIFYFYAMPSGVLYTISYKSIDAFGIKIGGWIALLVYIIMQIVAVAPIIYMIMFVSTININNEQVIHLMNSKIGFYRSYMALLGRNSHLTIRNIILAVCVVVINEMFGAQLLLRQELYPINFWLWELRPIYNNNMSVVFAVLGAVTFINMIIFIILELLLINNRYEKAINN
jgi:hypothetical protein